jgi:periplasmic protein TonB
VKWVLVVGSTALHGGLLLGLGRIEAKRLMDATAISVVESPEPPKSAEPPPPPPPPKERAVPRALTKAAPSAAKDEPKAKSEDPPPLDALPDLGLELDGVSGGGEGLAVRAPAQRTDRPSNAPTRKALHPAPKPTLDPCEQASPKPKLISLPKPSYTAAARQNGVEGKVRVRIQVDEKGAVIGASILESLGYGLDEAALEAARSARFEAALRCGKPVQAAFTVAMRFSAS